ncbi:MAG: arginyltransferase [Myxococcota bacterium]
MTQKLVYDGLQACPYLPGRVARMPLYRQLRRLTLDETDARLASAERRVGTCLYQTACPTCRACEGIRVPVRDFEPSKSQRRVLKRWAGHGRVEVGPTTLTADKLALFNRHKHERGLVAEEDGEMSPLGYASWLVQSCMLTVEMRYYFDERLVGVGIVDLGRRAASSVYFYFDPDEAALSPGVYSALQEIALCRRTGREHLYLGLYVEDCRHLSYKAGYRPHERRVDGAWIRD